MENKRNTKSSSSSVRMRIGIIGSGVSSLAAASDLTFHGHDVVVYESASHVGGHAQTVMVDDTAVDIGFQVFNSVTYPNMMSWFSKHGVQIEKSDMSFGVSIDNGWLEWASTGLNGLFAQRSNAVNPKFYQMVADMMRFEKDALNFLSEVETKTSGVSNAADAAELEPRTQWTLAQFIRAHGYSLYFINYYLLPVVAAIWSCSTHRCTEFPALFLLSFLRNHQMLQVLKPRPQWMTVAGRSQEYVRKVSAPFADKIRLNSEVTGIECLPDGRVRIIDHKGGADIFDHVVFGCHAPDTLRILQQSQVPLTKQEIDILGAFPYQENDVYLHTDISMMPRNKRAWASWNYLGGKRDSWDPNSSTTSNRGVGLTYWLNLLQNLQPPTIRASTPAPPMPKSGEVKTATTTTTTGNYSTRAQRREEERKNRLQALSSTSSSSSSSDKPVLTTTTSSSAAATADQSTSSPQLSPSMMQPCDGCGFKAVVRVSPPPSSSAHAQATTTKALDDEESSESGTDDAAAANASSSSSSSSAKVKEGLSPTSSVSSLNGNSTPSTPRKTPKAQSHPTHTAPAAATVDDADDDDMFAHHTHPSHYSLSDITEYLPTTVPPIPPSAFYGDAKPLVNPLYAQMACDRQTSHLSPTIYDDKPILITLNPPTPIKASLVVAHYKMSHPTPNMKSYWAQKEIVKIQGLRNIWYAGAYLGYGFHEDGCKSGMWASHAVQHKPWTAVPNHPPAPFSFPTEVYRYYCLNVLRRFITNGQLHIIELGAGMETVGTRASTTVPSVNLIVQNKVFWKKLMWRFDLGLCDAYIDGDITGDMLGLLHLLIVNRDIYEQNERESNARSSASTSLSLSRLLMCKQRSYGAFSHIFTRLITSFKHWSKRNTPTQSRSNISDHYDLGNDFFAAFLDKSRTYSCAIFKSPTETLYQAQMNKLNLIIEKAKISSHHKVLEIGFGWGSLSLAIAKKTGCRVKGITLSHDQLSYVTQQIKEQGLEKQVSVELVDFRVFSERPENMGAYDRIVSCEMLEAVGFEFLPVFFASTDRLLAHNGLMVIQVISYPDTEFDAYRREVDFIRERIFPGSLCPALSCVNDAMREGSSFVVEHVENIGPHYARTLAMWRAKFHANRAKIQAMDPKFDDKFLRMWDLYLIYCQAGFMTRSLGDYQIVYTRPRNNTLAGGYGNMTSPWVV